MNMQTLKYFALSSTLAGLLSITSLSGAQAGTGPKLMSKRVPPSAAQKAVSRANTPGSPSYTFTLLSYPGQLLSSALGINKGATTSKVEIVGGYGLTNGNLAEGFLAGVSGTKAVAETYRTVDVPHAAQSWANEINDLGEIVGEYVDSSGNYHSYKMDGGKFTEIKEPAGALGTFAESINNSGEIVGGYATADGNEYGFTLIGTTYTSFNYPGAATTSGFDVNNNGDIVGEYVDTSGVIHGFLLSGTTYTSIDFPGATETQASGINDSGDIVGLYCTTSACIDTLEGAQGFLLSGETFTTIAIPNEFYTIAVDINNNGLIVGYYQDAAGVVASFTATP